MLLLSEFVLAMVLGLPCGSADWGTFPSTSGIFHDVLGIHLDAPGILDASGILESNGFLNLSKAHSGGWFPFMEARCYWVMEARCYWGKSVVTYVTRPTAAVTVLTGAQCSSAPGAGGPGDWDGSYLLDSTQPGGSRPCGEGSHELVVQRALVLFLQVVPPLPGGWKGDNSSHCLPPDFLLCRSMWGGFGANALGYRGHGEVVQGETPAIGFVFPEARHRHLIGWSSRSTAVPQEGAPHVILTIVGTVVLTYLFTVPVILITILMGVRCTHLVGKYIFMVAAFHLISTAAAVCPGCSGNIASCTYTTDGKCPTLDTVSNNAGLVAGVAGLAVTALTLTNVISTRFLRMFTRAHLQLVLQLVRRPAPGTVFELTKTTKIAEILRAVGNGMITLEQAAITFAGFIDDASDADERAALTAKFKLITSTKDLKAFSDSNAVISDTGVYSWLWAKVTNFVAERGMHVKVDLEVGSSSSSAANVLSASIKRSKDFVDFAESLNIWILYTTALGLCSAVIATEFIEYCVFDTIRLRGHSWTVAHELFVIMLRRIEDSGGKVTMGNCINEAVLNTVLDEAVVSAKHHYGAAFFRQVAEGVRGLDGKEAGAGEGKPFNGKFTASSKEPCWHFNVGKPQP